ncbi:MAG: thioether cross-link-forming SCIFF peptide maturase, partial [Clostridia bacterium]|nr:thioether cross-link-forming SCIFF peptide maturase [Clostridia bacterium]
MIHCYKLGGLNIVLDIFSGSVHVVDEVAYDMIERYEQQSKEEITAFILEKYAHRDDVTEGDIADCFADIEALKEQGKLFTPDTFSPMAGALKQKTSGVVKALCLHV